MPSKPVSQLVRERSSAPGTIEPAGALVVATATPHGGFVGACALEIGPRQVNEGEVCAPQIGFFETPPTEVGEAKIRAS